MPKILYFDDEANAEKMISKFEILRDLGLEIYSYFKIDEILSICKEDLGQYDAIVVDLIMAPKHFLTLEETNEGVDTGKVIIRKIRENIKNEGIPIIIVSIRDRSSFDEYFLSRFNVKKFCVKPISAYELYDEILDAIRK